MYIYLFLALYLLLMLGIGIHSSKRIKTSKDFFVAGKRGNLWQVTGSLLATILGSSAILGTANLAYTQGWAAAWMMLSAALGLLVLAPLAARVSRMGKYTLPQLVGDFYGKQAKRIASVIIPLAWVGIVAAQIIGAAKILNSLAGINYTYGVLGAGLLFIIYTVVGGQVSILKTDQVQSLFILAGLVITAGYLVLQPDLAPRQLSAAPFPFNPGFSGFDLLVLLLTYSTTFTVGPDIYSRLFCAKNERVAKQSVALTALILIPFAFLIAFLGVLAMNRFPELNHAQGSALIMVLIETLPDWGIGLMVAALLSAVMSSADTTLLTASIIISDPLSKGLDSSKSLRNTRVLITLLGLLSILVALKITSIIQALLLALAIFSGALILPTAAGLLGYRTTTWRSTLAMIAGGTTALAGKLYAIYADRTIGNIVIIAAFAVNGLLLFSNVLKRKN